MKARLQRKGILSSYTREQRTPFGELDPIPVCFLELVGKRYPLKAVGTLEEENYSYQTERTWEHKALSGTDSVLCARCKSIQWEASEKGVYQPEERDQPRN